MAVTAPLDLVKACAWLGRRLHGGIDDAGLRAALVETISMARPELAGRAEGASLDWLRATFDELGYPPNRPRDSLASWLDELPVADAADVTSRRILSDGEYLLAGDPQPRKEIQMSRQSDSTDSPFVQAAARTQARQRGGLPALAFSKQAPGAPVPSRSFDGNETAVLEQLRKIIGLAERGELDRATAKEGGRLLDTLADLYEVTPDDPKTRKEQAELGDAVDSPSPFVRAVAKNAERQRAGLPPLAMNKDKILAERDGGDAA